jgi:ABC-type uncharacterized transport system permease subunit
MKWKYISAYLALLALGFGIYQLLYHYGSVVFGVLVILSLIFGIYSVLYYLYQVAIIITDNWFGSE